MHSEHRTRRVGVIGLPAGLSLFQLLDVNRRTLVVPHDGLLLSRKLATILQVGPGDAVQIDVLEGERPVRRVRVAGLIDDFSGLSAYMHLDALNSLLHEARTVSGAWLATDRKYEGRLYSELKATPQVASVTLRHGMLETFRETIAENLLRMKAWNVFFASVIAIGVVYNAARISLSERSRDLATLRVIGFTRSEISAILLGELAVLTLVAIPFGLFLGWVFAWFVALGLDTELYRIPLVINRATYAFAATVTLAATTIASLIVRRRLDRLDLVAVLKTRE